VHLFAQALRTTATSMNSSRSWVFERKPPPSSDVRTPASWQNLGIVNGRVRLMTVNMKGTTSGKIKRREGVLVVIVAAANDCPLAAFRH